MSAVGDASARVDLLTKAGSTLRDLVQGELVIKGLRMLMFPLFVKT